MNTQLQQFKYLRLFKYQTGVTPQQMLDNHDNLTPYKTYEIISNNIPNRIREASLYGIFGTETDVIDPNQVADINMSNPNMAFIEATSDNYVDGILYTNYEDQADYENNLAYMRYHNGHCEVVFIVDQAITGRDVYSDESESEYERVVLVTLETEDSQVIVATALTSAESPTYDDSIATTYMECSSNKIVRILIQPGIGEHNAILRPYQYLFSEVDLAILELTTEFDYRISAKWGAKKLFEFIDNYKFGVRNKSSQINNKFIQLYNNPIAECIDSVEVV